MAASGCTVLLALMAARACGGCDSVGSEPTDVVPPWPDFQLAPAEVTAGQQHCAGVSEVAEIMLMEVPGDAGGRSDCPHLRGDLAPLDLSSAAQASSENIEISEPTLLSACSFDPDSVYHRIVIRPGGELVFNDEDMALQVREILVMDGGKLYVGSETCPILSRVTVTFHGARQGSSLSNTFLASESPSKGLVASGTVDIHGKRFSPTWTRLAARASAGAAHILLQQASNWEVGQEIVVTTTVWFDCPEHVSYDREFCRPCPAWRECEPVAHQNELRRIRSLHSNREGATLAGAAPGTQWVELDEPLSYAHHASSEYQAEVALLSRRVVLAGTDSDEGFGGHTLASGLVRMSGVQARGMGQLNVVGRYPFHMHLLGEATSSYFRSCAVVNSHFRAFVLHGTNASAVVSNVAFNVSGHAFYLENGVEERNTIRYNLAAHVHPIKMPADGGNGQDGELFFSAPDLFLPADASAAGFYIPNAYNTIEGNAAVGGWAGFAFPNLEGPTGEFRGVDLGLHAPARRPVLSFKANCARSSGFYWQGHGSCVYIGARLHYGEDDVQSYSSGRYSRESSWGNGTAAVMVFESLKTALCHKGVAHWGDRVQLVRSPPCSSGKPPCTTPW